MNPSDVHEQVSKHYAGFAQDRIGGKSQSGCCSSTCCSPSDTIPVQALAALGSETTPTDDLVQMSLGCGTPLELAQLKPGETVLDLGSGGGLDCFYAARLVGESGHVIGVDMTPEMLALANSNKAKVGIDNVEFRRGYLEDLPVGNASVDVIISNCVINLSPDKDSVFREAIRVLKPGGRVVFSDMVARVEMPAGLRKNPESWAECISGAITRQEYVGKMAGAGFSQIQVVGQPSNGDLVYSAKFQARKEST